MQYMQRGFLIIFLLLLTAGAQNVANGDPSAALAMCTACHGDDGIGADPGVPIIAGIPAVVQEDALYAYMDGDRTCGSKPMKCTIVNQLTEDQVVELAAHYAALPFKPAIEEFDAALAEEGKKLHDADCGICHGDSPSDADASILLGQRKEYLRHSLEQYAAGERAQLPAMEQKTSQLSAEQIEALLNYYASYRN